MAGDGLGKNSTFIFGLDDDPKANVVDLLPRLVAQSKG
jgi:hypothetical protein